MGIDDSDHAIYGDTQQALAKLESFQGAIVVDLDETLLLRNSTEEFLSWARPAWLAFCLLKLLDILKPWRMTGGNATRDVWRLRCMMVLCPWLHAMWRRKAPQIAQRYANRPLLDLILRQDIAPRVTIATVGFRKIVTPLVAALGIAPNRLIAIDGLSCAQRKAGKLPLVTAVLGMDGISQALVLTDSPDDLPLLKQCKEPLLVRWPDALYHPALFATYFPGHYMSMIKRPGQRYFFRGVLQEDYLLWLLASLPLALHPLSHVLGLLLLLQSFWCIYEYGYVDNDKVAERYESVPSLTEAYRLHGMQVPFWLVVIWTTVFGVAGLIVIKGDLAIGWLSLIWALVLVTTMVWFKIYNRVDKHTRVWLFPGLQFARSCAFAVVAPLTLLGSLAIGSHVLSRWVPYVMYRSTNQANWPDVKPQLLRLMFFLILSVLLALTEYRSLLISWSMLAIVAWHLMRARSELAEALSGAFRLGRKHD